MVLEFAASQRSTVGLEWELALVDADSGDMRQAGPAVVDALTPADGSPHPRRAAFTSRRIRIETIGCKQGPFLLQGPET